MREQKLPLRLLKTDFSYQSPVKNAQVLKIVRNFDSKALHTIVVSEREDGTYYIVDGQHRVVALIRLGHEEIRCTIHQGLSVEEEAKMYHDLNNRPTKQANSKGKSKLRYNEENAVKIDEIVNKTGMKINYEHTAPKSGYIAAYGALERIYKRSGGTHLNNVIVAIKASFGESGNFFQAYIMDGFSKFLRTYQKDLDFQFMVDRLGNIGFDKFIEKVENETHKFKDKKECLPFVIADIYNYNKKKNPLDKRLLIL